MSKGPSKILYAAGGWFLGGIVGSLVGTAVFLGVAALTSSAPVLAGVIFGAQLLALGTSIIGAVKGWSAASKAQSQYAAFEQSAIQRPSRGQEMDMSPQRAAEESISQGSGKNWVASVNEERAAQAMAATQR